jgi:hypothetical protein
VVRAAKQGGADPQLWASACRSPRTWPSGCAKCWRRAGWGRFPDDVREWLEMQDWRSRLPGPGNLLVESFPHRGLAYTAYFTFEGWNANQSLGMLITRRMEDRGLMPGASSPMIIAWQCGA